MQNYRPPHTPSVTLAELDARYGGKLGTGAKVLIVLGAVCFLTVGFLIYYPV